MGFPRDWTEGADRKRLKALGNAVVPQIVEVIGRAIMEIHGHGTDTWPLEDRK